MALTLRSKNFKNGDLLPNEQVINGMGYSGDNRSPHLSWDGAPAGTRSFAITMYDPDAPTGSGWWHWVVANIPSNVHEFPEGAGNTGSVLPAGVLQTITDFGVSGYNGAGTPKRQSHRYIFTIHALSVDKLDIKENSSGAAVGAAIYYTSLGSATLTTHFGS
ncbi:kinase inhibitor [Chryseobacterium sp. T20]|uniref:kinase inhibitor n=1 Tax=Chryseobacterium sp. T20 TaxID=3395375 RepID=UPI0039BD1305